MNQNIILTKNYFILADQYYQSSKLLLENIINSGNMTFGFGKSEKEAEENMQKNVLKSDSILFLPALFDCYQCMELFVKGLILIKNVNFENTHEIDILFNDLKELYNDKTEIYKVFKNFYHNELDIIKKFKKENKITTINEFYMSLRYPNYQQKKYDYICLKYNGKDGINHVEKLIKMMESIREIVLKEYHDYIN